MRQISWLRPSPLLLLLHMGLLLRFQFVHPILFLLRRVPRPRGFVSLFLFLLRFLLSRRRSLLQVHLRLGVLLLLPLLSSLLVIFLLPSPRLLWETAKLWGALKKEIWVLWRAPLFLGKWCGVATYFFIQKNKKKKTNYKIHI